jgi:hypothetical protein
MQAKPPIPSNAPIFIVGYIHTGTSLLKSMLRKDPSLFTAAGETHFYQDLNRYRRQFADLDNPQVFCEYVYHLTALAYLGTKRANQRQEEYNLATFNLDEARFERVVAAARRAVEAVPATQRHAALFGLVMDELTRLDGKQRWLEKTPEHVYFLQQILSVRADARVIDLVRDPRAALSSRKHRRTDEWLDAKEAQEQVEPDRTTNYDPLIDSYMWRESVDSARDARRAFAGRVLTVRYEDMVSDPEPTVRHICDFLDLPFRPEFMEVGWINATTKNAQNAGEGISRAAVDRWKKSLTPEEIYICQTALRRELKEFGYPFEPIGLGTKVKTPVVLGRSAVHLAQRIGKRRPAGIDQRRSDTVQRMYRRVARTLGAQK